MQPYDVRCITISVSPIDSIFARLTRSEDLVEFPIGNMRYIDLEYALSYACDARTFKKRSGSSQCVYKTHQFHDIAEKPNSGKEMLTK